MSGKRDKGQTVGPSRSRAVLYVGGAARGNPGDAGIGVVLLREDGRVLQEFGRYLGMTTPLAAEYAALAAGIQLALEMQVQELLVRSASEALVRQVLGEQRASPDLQPLLVQVRRLLMRLKGWHVEAVSKEENREAERLAQEGIDARSRT